jgi:peroxiredoxin Q/BCP
MKLWTGAVCAGAAALAGASFGAEPIPAPAATSVGSGPAVGDLAPQFRLEDQNGNWVSLADSKGKWTVLYFYPKDMTPGCTTQACEFRDNIFDYRRANAVILGVSVDDVASHKNFEKEKSLPFTLLADYRKEVTRRYGVLNAREVASRETFLIDPQGRIVKRYKVGPAELPDHSKTVLADIAALSGAPAKAKG